MVNFSDIVRRLAAFGALTRMTGFDDVVFLDQAGLAHDDGGGNWLRLRKDQLWGFDADGGDLLPDEEADALGEDLVNLRFAFAADGRLLGEPTEEVAANWLDDESATDQLADWLEQYLDDVGSVAGAADQTAGLPTISRAELSAFVAAPFSPPTVEQLAARLPNVDVRHVHDFLGAVWHWPGA